MSCAGCVRVFMIIFNFLFTIVGFVLLCGGLYFFFTESNAKVLDTQVSHLGILLLIIAGIGFTTFLLGILGCCGAFHYSRCILGFYFILLLLLFAGEISLGVFGFYNKEAVKQGVDSFLVKSMSQGSGEQGSVVKLIEQLFDCCGYTDTLEAKFQCNWDVMLRPSCKSKLDIITQNVYVFFTILLVLALTQLIGLIFSSILCCAAKDRVQYNQYHPVYQ